MSANGVHGAYGFVRASLCAGTSAWGENPGHPLGGAPVILGENKEKTKSEIKQVS